MVATPKRHPDRDDLREIPAGSRVFLCGEDAGSLTPGDRLRLKNLYDIEVVDTELPTPTVKRIGTAAQEWCTIEEKPRYRIIHWVPDMQDECLRVVVRAPDRVYEGFGEAGIASELGNTVQFERFGFVRIDSVDVRNRSVVAYFAHR